MPNYGNRVPINGLCANYSLPPTLGPLACRYGPALLPLAYALHKCGDRDLVCRLLARCLPPKGLTFDGIVELRPWHISALKELLPLAAKHGGWVEAHCVVGHALLLQHVA